MVTSSGMTIRPNPMRYGKGWVPLHHNTPQVTVTGLVDPKHFVRKEKDFRWEDEKYENAGHAL